jgi:hypothetical protein
MMNEAWPHRLSQPRIASGIRPGAPRRKLAHLRLVHVLAAIPLRSRV